MQENLGIEAQEALSKLAAEQRRAFEDIAEVLKSGLASHAAVAITSAVLDELTPSRSVASQAQAAAQKLHQALLEQQRVYWAALQEPLRRIEKLWTDLPPRTQRALSLLGHSGWYLDPDMPLQELWSVSDALEKGHGDDVDRFLAEYYDSALDGIETRLRRAYPDRARIVAAALGAPRRAEFELSVPVLLAQADGICQQATGVQLYRRRHGTPRTAQWVKESASDKFRRAMLQPLVEPLPISDSLKEAGFDAQLNRHSVLHGTNLEYATRNNSLRAESLLCYVGLVVARPEPPTA